MDYTAADVTSLGRKLDGLDLTDAESAALTAVFDAAAGSAADEVAGFGLPHEHQNPFSARLGSILFFDEADALFGKRTGTGGFIGETEKNLGADRRGRRLGSQCADLGRPSVDTTRTRCCASGQV